MEAGLRSFRWDLECTSLTTTIDNTKTLLITINLTRDDPMSTNAATIENLKIHVKINKDIGHQSISCPPRRKAEIAQARLGTLLFWFVQ